MADLRTYGGFIGWGPPGPQEIPWPGQLLASGRSCLTAIAVQLKVSTFHVPFLICDSVVAPLREAGMNVRFYRVDEQARPVLEDIPDDGGAVLSMDQYGVRPDGEQALVQAFGDRVVLDRTHALHNPVPPGHWAFCSLRKWFGAAEGAWLQGPVPVPLPVERNTQYRLDHLLLATVGHTGEALEAYRHNNALMSLLPQRPSLVSERILLRADREAAQHARIRNFQRLHQRLGTTNRLIIDPERTTGAICYPYQPTTPVALDTLHAAGIYAPRYWPEVLQRADPEGRFKVERALVQEVIALPVDQRYTPDDMDAMLERWPMRY